LKQNIEICNSELVFLSPQKSNRQKDEVIAKENTDSNFTSEAIKERIANLSLLKKLDDQIEDIKKNKASLDILEAVAESTLRMCMDNQMMNEVTPSYVNNEFYEQIEKELSQLESQL